MSEKRDVTALLFDEALNALVEHVEVQPVGGLEISVDHGMWHVEITTADDRTEWAEHLNLTDAMNILLGLLDG